MTIKRWLIQKSFISNSDEKLPGGHEGEAFTEHVYKGFLGITHALFLLHASYEIVFNRKLLSPSIFQILKQYLFIYNPISQMNKSKFCNELVTNYLHFKPAWAYFFFIFKNCSFWQEHISIIEILFLFLFFLCITFH